MLAAACDAFAVIATTGTDHAAPFTSVRRVGVALDVSSDFITSPINVQWQKNTDR